MRTRQEIGKNKKVVDGFGSRLQTLMDFAGLGKYGRRRLIARWSGLSDSTASYLFKNDNGPRSDAAIIAIADGLADAITSCRDIRIIKSDLIDYLLGKMAFPDLENWIENGETRNYHREAYVVMAILTAMKENKALMEDGSIYSIEFISEIIIKLDKFICLNELSYDSETVFAYVKDLIKKSTSTLPNSL